MKWIKEIVILVLLAVVGLLLLAVVDQRHETRRLRLAVVPAKKKCPEKPPGEPDEALLACLGKLENAMEAKKAAEAVVQGKASESPAPGASSVPPTAGKQEEDGAQGGGPPTVAPPAPPEQQAAAEKEKKKKRSEKVRKMFVDQMSLQKEEVVKITRIVCAIAAFKGSVLDDLADGSLGAGQAWDELVAMRKEMTADLEAILGKERYENFREVGGIAAFGEVADCDSVQGPVLP